MGKIIAAYVTSWEANTVQVSLPGFTMILKGFFEHYLKEAHFEEFKFQIIE